MPYGDFKEEQPKYVDSVDPKYERYHRCLDSMVYKFFD